MANVYKSVLASGGTAPTGNAVPADVLTGKTFSNADGTDKVGTMTNNGAVAPTALDPGGSYTIPQGYHNGNGVVSAKANTATYTANTRGTALDMGAANLNRYVNTSGVPNSNSGTYTFPVNDTGGTKDLGDTNAYRYVNAQNVYNKGKADGAVGSHSQFTVSAATTQNVNLGYSPSAVYLYVKTATRDVTVIYDGNINANTFTLEYIGGGSGGTQVVNLGNTDAVGYGISFNKTNTGFTLTTGSIAIGTWHYVASA